MQYKQLVTEIVESIREGYESLDDLLGMMGRAIPTELLNEIESLRSKWGAADSRIHRQFLEHNMACMDALSTLREDDQLDEQQLEAHLRILIDFTTVIDKLDSVGIKIPKTVGRDLDIIAG